MVNCVSGTALALLTVLALVVRFSIEKFAIEGRPWSNTYIQHYIDAVVIGVTVLVVAIPEGLPLAVTLALAYSVKVSSFLRIPANGNKVNNPSGHFSGDYISAIRVCCALKFF